MIELDINQVYESLFGKKLDADFIVKSIGMINNTVKIQICNMPESELNEQNGYIA